MSKGDLIMKNRFEFIGKATTVGELIDLFRDNGVSEDNPLYLTGVECNVIVEYNVETGEVTQVMLDDDDYSELWNEENEGEN